MSKKVAVLRGGVGKERQKSLEYGFSILNILKNFREHNVSLHDIVLHPNGAWSLNGYLKNVDDVLNEVDIVWIALVGDEGEEGSISEILEKKNKKFIGHSSLSSKLSHHKKNLHEVIAQHNVKTPYSKVIEKKNFSLQDILENFKFVGVPSIVKPVSGSNMFMVDLITHYEDLLQHAEKIIYNGSDVLIEKYISGISVSVFIYEYENIVNTAIYVHNEKDWINIKKEDLLNVRNEALKIHHTLGFTHHVEYDFIINKNGIYFIEANTYPTLTQDFLKNALDTKVLQDYIFYNLRKVLELFK
jgi:D-alanine-D-alanine ligase